MLLAFSNDPLTRAEATWIGRAAAETSPRQVFGMAAIDGGKSWDNRRRPLGGKLRRYEIVPYALGSVHQASRTTSRAPGKRCRGADHGSAGNPG
jgi:hypothetical protein